MTVAAPPDESKTDLTRAILASMPRVHAQGMPGHTVAILARTVAARGFDLATIRAWVLDAGGEEGYLYVSSEPAVVGGRSVRAPMHPELYFAIPLKVLEPED